MMAQLSGRNSLRDIVENMAVQAHHLYHLGSAKLSRSNLSRMNNDKPYTLYEALFGKLLARCQPVVPRHKFRFKNLLYSLDASTIDLCLGVFPWADFRKKKGAVKLHVGLNHAGYLPELVTITDGKVHDVTVGRTLKWRIQLQSATLPLRSLNQFSKDGLRLLEAKAFPRSQVQPPFYPGYKLIANRSHIGSLRDVLPEQPVKVLIQPALPR